MPIFRKLNHFLKLAVVAAIIPLGSGASAQEPAFSLSSPRKLPCQVDNLKLEISLTNFLGMNSIGATSPRDSCGLNSL